MEHRWNIPRGCPVVPHMHNCASRVGPQTGHRGQTPQRPRRSGARRGCPGCLYLSLSLSCGQGGCDAYDVRGPAHACIQTTGRPDMPRRTGPLDMYVWAYMHVWAYTTQEPCQIDGYQTPQGPWCGAQRPLNPPAGSPVLFPSSPGTGTCSPDPQLARRCSPASRCARYCSSTASRYRPCYPDPPTPGAVPSPPGAVPPPARCNQPGTGTGEHVTGPATQRPATQRPRHVSQQAEERVARPDVWVLPGQGVPEHGNSIG
jgi:hypothetical protein